MSLTSIEKAIINELFNMNTYKRAAGPRSRHYLARKGYNAPQPAKVKVGGGYPHKQPAPK